MSDAVTVEESNETRGGGAVVPRLLVSLDDGSPDSRFAAEPSVLRG